jgi:tetratricopeptide (TPR) repeat protein
MPGSSPSIPSSMELMLLTLSRDFAAAKSYAEKLPAEYWETDWSRPQIIGDLEQFAGNKGAARKNYEDARVLLLAANAREPDEPQGHADLGAVAAALGLKEEALRAAQRAIELEPVEKNARTGLSWLVNLALVQMRLNQPEEAINNLEKVMKLPNSGEALSGWQLKLDPIWDSLRSHPRFKTLIGTEETTIANRRGAQEDRVH